MVSIVNNSVAAAKKYGLGYDLIAGANLAGAEKVIEAMIAQGNY
jgi:glutamate dehydrogenase (NADP+)